jgi:hypothetical protein
MGHHDAGPRSPVVGWRRAVHAPYGYRRDAPARRGRWSQSSVRRVLRSELHTPEEDELADGFSAEVGLGWRFVLRSTPEGAPA